MKVISSTRTGIAYQRGAREIGGMFLSYHQRPRVGWVAVWVGVARVGRTLLFDAFDLDVAFDLGSVNSSAIRKSGPHPVQLYFPPAPLSALALAACANAPYIASINGWVCPL